MSKVAQVLRANAEGGEVFSLKKDPDYQRRMREATREGFAADKRARDITYSRIHTKRYGC